jgi:hypothetical protein
MKITTLTNGWQYWYDRSVRVWVAAKFDAEGNQITDCIYAGSKREILQDIQVSNQGYIMSNKIESNISYIPIQINGEAIYFEAENRRFQLFDTNSDTSCDLCDIANTEDFATSCNDAKCQPFSCYASKSNCWKEVK